jgi:predicted esterase
MGHRGYSEGGFCAANLGLKSGTQFGFSGVLSGYFVPSDSQFGHRQRPAAGRLVEFEHAHVQY